MINTQKIIWVHPTLVIDLFNGLRSIESYDEIQNNRDYYKSREAWISAMFLIGKERRDGLTWYLSKNDEENSIDDIYGLPFWKEKDTTYSTNIPLPIQVFRYTKYDPTILEIMKKKFRGDLKGCSLVCYILKKETINWQILNRELEKIKPNVKDISLVGNISSGQYVVGEVYPEIHNSIIDLSKIKAPISRIIQPQRVFSGDKTGVFRIGKKALITTKFETIEDNSGDD